MTTAFHRLSDADLLVWSKAVATQLVAEPERFFVSQQQADAYAAARLVFANRLAIASDPTTRTKPSVEAKRVARDELLRQSRHLVSVISSNPACTNAMREELNIGVRAQKRRAIPVPSEKPFVTILGVQRAMIDLRITDSIHPRNMGPDIAGAEIYLCIGERPIDQVEQWQFVCTTTRTRVQLSLPLAASAQTVWITCRFVNRRAQPGPSSDPTPVNLPAFSVLPNQSSVKIAA